MLEEAASKSEAEIYVHANLEKLMVDLPFDYFQAESKNHRIRNAQTLERKSLCHPRNAGASCDANCTFLSIQFAGCRDASGLQPRNEKWGYDPNKFPTVIFDVLQYSGSNSPVKRTMLNITNNLDVDGNNYLQNVINAEISNNRLHELVQSADQIQSNIDAYELALEASRATQNKLKLEIDVIQMRLDASKVQGSQNLLEERAEVERKIVEERAKQEKIESEKFYEKERICESPDLGNI